MPTVTYQQPDALGPALSGVAGAFAGEAEGKKYVEGVRQFDVTLDENKRQFDNDLNFRIKQLQVMRAENALTREQEQRLQYLEQKWQSGENVLTKEHEVGIQQRDLTSKEKINTEQLRQSDTENKRNVGVQHRRITVEDENFEAEYRQKNEQLKDNQFRLNTVGQIKLKYPEARPNTPAYEAAKQEYLQTVSAPGSTTGQQGVQQLTPEERGAFEQQFDTLFQNYDKEVVRQVDEMKKFTVAKAEAQAGPEAEAQIKVEAAREGRVPPSAAGPANLGNVELTLTNLYDKNNFSEATGDYELDVDSAVLPSGKANPLFAYRDQINELDTEMVDYLATEVMNTPFDLTTKAEGSQGELAVRRTGAKVEEAINRMTGLPPEIKEQMKDYYNRQITNVIQIHDPERRAVMQGAGLPAGPSGPPTGAVAPPNTPANPQSGG